MASNSSRRKNQATRQFVDMNHKYFKRTSQFRDRCFIWSHFFFQGTCIFCMDKFLKGHFCRSLPCMIDSISRHIFKTPMFLNILVFKHKTKVLIFWVSFNVFQESVSFKGNWSRSWTKHLNRLKPSKNWSGEKNPQNPVDTTMPNHVEKDG